MPLVAKNHEGLLVFSRNIEDRNQKYFCPTCNETLIFVNAKLKTKHFRHRTGSTCTNESEPETEEHIHYKYLIHDQLEMLYPGKVYLEHPIGLRKADVYLERPNKNDIAFEIQATNIDFSEYEKKIKYYAFRKLLTIYIFTEKNFLHETKENIFSLKEIEKRIFIEKTYLDSVVGYYIDGNSLFSPYFKHKYAKGNRGYCTSRFIISHQKSKKIPIGKFVSDLDDLKIINSYKPECFHEKIRYEKSNGKVIRYKKVCLYCNRYIKWLSNNEAIKLGLKL